MKTSTRRATTAVAMAVLASTAACSRASSEPPADGTGESSTSSTTSETARTSIAPAVSRPLTDFVENDVLPLVRNTGPSDPVPRRGRVAGLPVRGGWGFAHRRRQCAVRVLPRLGAGPHAAIRLLRGPAATVRDHHPGGGVRLAAHVGLRTVGDRRTVAGTHGHLHVGCRRTDLHLGRRVRIAGLPSHGRLVHRHLTPPPSAIATMKAEK